VATAAKEGDAVKAFIRPELVSLVEPGEARSGDNRLKGTVANTVFSGSLVSITVAVGEGRHITVERQSGDAASRIETGRAVEVLLPEEALQILPA
jgi:ABC-type Fe3+/spermidine/putrescine transport system ATPase subunit